MLYFHDDVITSRWHHGDVIRSKVLLKLFYYSRPNLLVKFNEKWVTWTNFTKKKLIKWFYHILASFSHLHWVTIDKIAIIQKRIKLFSNLSEIFRKRAKRFFSYSNIFYGGELILPTPWRLGFKSEAKPEKSKKSKSWCILKFKMWSRNILENMLKKIVASKVSR